MSLSTALQWERENSDWPHQQYSQFVHASNVRWHVQILGEGPVIVLVHGTGASTHSWADLASALSSHWRVVMMDLPGHGFTSAASNEGSSLRGMSAGIGSLLDALELSPQLVVGHSAGAAILAQMCLDQRIKPKALVSFNGAFLPFDGLLGGLFSQMAKMFSRSGLVPWFFSRQAKDGKAVQRLIDQTGSQIPPASAACYQTLLRSQGHVSAALRMMANWDLDPLHEALPRLSMPLHLVAGSRDKTVPISQARHLQTHIPAAQFHEMSGLGHLGHEECPDMHAQLLDEIMAATGDQENLE